MSDQVPTSVKASAQPQPSTGSRRDKKTRLIIAGVGLGVVVVLALVIFGLTRDAQATAIVRDIMIILLAFTSLVIGFFLIVLVYQLALLTRLLRDEIKPLLESANETMNTLRGTTVFMSDAVVEPAIKAASTVAGVQRVLKTVLGLRPKKTSQNPERSEDNE